MPKLSELTDYQPIVPEELPVAASAATPAVPKSKGVIENIINKLIGANGEERYQLWPEKMVKDALTAIPTISQPNPYPEGSEENYWYEDQRQKAMIPAALNMSALAGTGGLAGTGKGGVALGAGPTYPLAKPSDRWTNTLGQNDHLIKNMSPDEFLAKARKLKIDDESRENIDALKKHIEEGKPLDPLELLPNGKEDGRHRAIAAKELGIEQVPVINFRK